jgi:hypothetical protein
MVPKLFEALRGLAHRFETAPKFEAYYANLQRGGIAGAPTRDEARQEYHAALEQRSWHETQ